MSKDELTESSVENVFSDLADLELERPKQAIGNIFPLVVEAHFGRSHVSSEDGTFSFNFGIRDAYLKLETSGCKIALGTRGGEHDVASPVREEFREKRVSRRKGAKGIEAAGSLSSSGTAAISISGKAGRTAELDTQNEKHTESVEDLPPLMAYPSGRWRAYVGDSRVLQGRVFRPTEALCEIELLETSYSVTASIGFPATSRNIDLQDVEDLGGGKFRKLVSEGANIKREEKIKMRALKLIIAKALSKSGNYVNVVSKKIDGDVG